MSDTVLWPSGRGLVVSLVVNVEEGAEASPARGDASAEAVDELGIRLRSARNLPNESNYQYGIREGFKRVVDVLDSSGVPATWACAAQAIVGTPQIAKVIRARGDEVACHGLRWIHQFRLSREEERSFIRDATDAIEREVGVRPAGYLARYLTTEATRAILSECGYLYDMNDYSADFPFWDRTTHPPIVVVPYAIDTNDMLMWPPTSRTPAEWLRYLEATFEVLAREAEDRPVMMSVGLHLRVIGRPGRISGLRGFIARAGRSVGARFATRKEIAKRFIELRPLDEGATPE